AAMLHAVESAIRCSKKFFRCITIFRKRGHAGACGKSRAFRFRGHTFANAGDDARSNVAASFRQNDVKFVSAEARSCINSAAVVTDKSPKANQSPAASQMILLFVYGFQAVHIKKGHAERALRAARTIWLGFHSADKAAIVRKPRQRIAYCESAHLIEQARLIQKSSAKHDDIARSLAEFRQEERRIQKMARKRGLDVASDVSLSVDEK